MAKHTPLQALSRLVGPALGIVGIALAVLARSAAMPDQRMSLAGLIVAGCGLIGTILFEISRKHEQSSMKQQRELWRI